MFCASLANHYKTRFVSTEKLAKAAIHGPTLGMIPKHVAEALAIFPVVFDSKTHTLSVVTADPDDVQTLRNVQSVSGAKQVQAFVARPRAVKAAIARAHNGDLQAFARLELAAQAQMHGLLDVRRSRSEVPAPPPREAPKKAEEAPRRRAGQAGRRTRRPARIGAARARRAGAEEDTRLSRPSVDDRQGGGLLAGRSPRAAQRARQPAREHARRSARPLGAGGAPHPPRRRADDARRRRASSPSPPLRTCTTSARWGRST